MSEQPSTLKFSLDVLSLERFRLDGGAMFGIIPKPLWERQCPADSKNRIAMGCQCLLLRGQGRIILVDAGMGDKWDQKSIEIYAIEGTAPSALEHALSEHGLKPEQITDVVVTHLHFDHAGGLTRRDSQGDLQPTFGQARHWIQAEHLDWARNPSEKDRGSFPSENIDPLSKSDLFALVKGEQEIYPGLRTIPLFGHTKAMQALLIEGDQPVFFPADLIPMSAHLHLPFIMAYDIAPLETLEEKKLMLEQATRNQWQIIFEHEPYETRGRVEMFQGKYRLGRD